MSENYKLTIMKELTIEEKAKAYDEAIERANSLLSGNELGNAWIYKLLPELKESEDKRIRKRLIELVEEIRKANPTNAEHNGMCSEAKAWLEKQGEQNPAWSEDDERISSNINLYIRKAGDYPHFGKENIKEARNWMNALKDRVQPQPKQEWSKEDENTVASIISSLSNPQLYPPTIHDIEWLKFLKDRYTWKPSEYELKVLKLAAEKDGACLMGLYQQLKKLRRE